MQQFTDVEVSDEAYGVTWNGSVEVPTKNAVYDQIELKANLASPTFTGTVTSPTITATTIIKLPGYTVATLPAGNVGDKAYVTDASLPMYNAIVIGGGLINIEVFYNGTN